MALDSWCVVAWALKCRADGKGGRLTVLVLARATCFLSDTMDPSGHTLCTVCDRE